tara:strand:- start:518 stop:838 length:321 start_codon:yes stop_codon:yes gene_type:complete
MIPSIRSIQELIEISKSRIRSNKLTENCRTNNLTEDSGQRKRYIRAENDGLINLPSFVETTRAKWRKSKSDMGKLIEDLDYNNQKQSTYDITLLERAHNNDQRDVA